MRKQVLAILYILIPVFIWGISFINTKVLMAMMDSTTLGLIRFILATLCMLFASFILKRWSPSFEIERIPFKQHKSFMIAGGIGITVYIYLENIGIEQTSASIASLLIAIIPLVSIVGEFIAYRRKILPIDMLSIGISLLGVLILVGENPLALFQAGKVQGYLYMFGAVVSWVIYSLVTKGDFEKYSVFTVLFYQTLYGAIFFVPFLLFTENHLQVESFMQVFSLAHLLFLVIFASIVAFYFYIKAIDALGIYESSIYINFIPVVTLIFAFFMLGERIELRELMGGGLILFSVIFSSFYTKKADAQSQPVSLEHDFVS